MKKLMLFLLVLTASAAVPADQTQHIEGSPLPDIPAFVDQLESLRKTANIPGLSVAVIRNQAIVLATGLGYADLQQRIPATADTAYNIASVTKPLAAVVALRLVENGILDLDRPMSEFSEWEDFCSDFSEQPSIFARGLR
ncbi:MAG: serine hydrolase domain-containing protein, partial [Gammaproteobacteria bacterium]